MKSKVVAILETRAGEHLAELLARRGAVPLHAPALEEVADVDLGAVAALLQTWRTNPFHVAIFQTGVGTRALFQATDSLGSTPEFVQLLKDALVMVRGPKPVGELNGRGVRIDGRAASPFTSDKILEALAAVELDGRRVFLQRYGESNRKLCAALEARGAAVQEFATYRWSLPEDIRPLIALIHALTARRVDAVVFTSAVQVRHLHDVAARLDPAAKLRELLQGSIVASIGPVCSRALAEHGVHPTFEANPPKLGPLVAGLELALGCREAADNR